MAANETLTVTYNLTLTDELGHDLPQQVVITLTGSNDAPMIGVKTVDGGVTENAHAPTETAAGTVAFDDVDVTDAHVVSAAFKSTDYSSQLGTLTAVKTTDTTGSGAGGLITWTFSANDSAIAQLAAGQTVHETYTITLDDQHGGVIAQDVIVTITGANDVPVVGAATLTGTVFEDAHTPTESASGTINFADVDLTDSHTVSATPGGNGYLGTFTPIVSDNSTGDGTGQVTWTFAVDNAALQFLADGQTLTQTYTVTVNDGHTGGTVNQLVAVTITGTEDKPTITAAVASGSVTEDNLPTTASGTINFADVDLTNTHTVSATPGGTAISALSPQSSATPRPATASAR